MPLVLRHRVRVLERHVSAGGRPIVSSCHRLLLGGHRRPEAALRAFLHLPWGAAGSSSPHAPRVRSSWVTKQARNFTWELTELGLRPRFVICNRDANSAAAFDSVLAAEGTEVRWTPPRSPRANSIAERWVSSPGGAGLASGPERAPPQVHPRAPSRECRGRRPSTSALRRAHLKGRSSLW